MSTRRYTVSVGDRSYTIDVLETAADRFEVSVDGQLFEATLHGDHDLPGSAIAPGIASAETAAAAPPAEPEGVSARPAANAPPSLPGASRHAPKPAGSGGGRADVMAAPMPGVVLEVLVAPGATLRRGDPVLVLEAMKMRNTIRCPRDAVVVEIAVAAGQPVGPGDTLVRLGDATT
jgi:biotin carboxyl carrier protein